MAKIDSVGRGFQHNLVHPHNFAFAKRCNFEFVLALPARFADYALNRDCRSRRRIFFMNVMPLEDLSRVVVTQRCSGGPRDVKKQIYSYRKICPVNESGTLVLDELFYAIYFFVPSCGPNDHILARFDASLDMSDNAVGSGEINDHINVAQLVRIKRSSSSIFGGPSDLNAMSALARDLRDQRSCLSSTKQEDVHDQSLTAKLAKNCDEGREEVMQTLPDPDPEKMLYANA